MMELAVLPAHSGHVTSGLFSPDGQTLVAAGMAKVMKLWGAASWELLRTLEGHHSSVKSLSMSAGGQLLASCSVDKIDDGSARVLTLANMPPS